MWFDGKRQPNTIYVASVSRGKDSTAMLRAIQLMGWPLDAIYSVDIWATQDIPAELPPMVAFKDEWDRKCLDWFGTPVTRCCAVKREREPQADGECFRRRISYEDLLYRPTVKGKFIGTIKGFPMQRGPWCNKLKTSAVDIRGHILSSYEASLRERERERERENRTRMAFAKGSMVQRPPQAGSAGQDSQRGGLSIARENSSGKLYGFPMRKGNWCTSYLKQGAKLPF